MQIRELSCTQCHEVHAGHRGLTFESSGNTLDHGAGWETIVADTSRQYRPERSVSVPLVSAAACRACHAAEASPDTLARCLDPTGRFVVCFDEHRQAGTVGPSDAARDGAWQAARGISAKLPSERQVGLLKSAGSIAFGLFTALIALALVKRRRSKKTPVPPSPLARPIRQRGLPVIDPTRCLGCYACVDACPYDVLEVRAYVAIVARPDDCCGLTLCEQRCPNGSLVVQNVGARRPGLALNADLESADAPYVYFAGDVTGQSLIVHAMEQGATAVQSIAASLRGSKGRGCGDILDLAIVGAGPAGLAAALEAKARSVSYVVLEQASVAHSIRSFPRDKLVIDPGARSESARLWFGACSKEELLSRWLISVRRERLSIREGERVVAVERSAGGPPHGHFEIVTEARTGERHRVFARRVLVAIGRRGSPRRLAVEVPEGLEHRVHYSLLDARSFAGKPVVVVGLGDAAMEAAMALAHQPGTHVTVCHRGTGFRRGKRRNIDEMRRLSEAGRLTVLFATEIERVAADVLTLATPVGPRTIHWNALFVMIGSLPSAELFGALGLGQERERA
jgi:thioredoxin reductase